MSGYKNALRTIREVGPSLAMRLDLRLHTAVGLKHTGHKDELILMKTRGSHVCLD